MDRPAPSDDAMDIYDSATARLSEEYAAEKRELLEKIELLQASWSVCLLISSISELPQ